MEGGVEARRVGLRQIDHALRSWQLAYALLILVVVLIPQCREALTRQSGWEGFWLLVMLWSSIVIVCCNTRVDRAAVEYA